MIIANYKTKKELTAAKGSKLDFTESNQFGTDYMSTGTFSVAHKDNKWTAEVTLVDDVITAVK